MVQQVAKGSNWMSAVQGTGVVYPTEDYSAPMAGSTVTATAGSSVLVDAQSVVIDRVIIDASFTTDPLVTFFDQTGLVELFSISIGGGSGDKHEYELGLVIKGGFSVEVTVAALARVVVSYHKVGKDYRTN